MSMTPYNVQTVIKDKKGPRLCDLAVLLPHDLVHQLYQHDPDHFHSRFLGASGVEELPSFWRRCSREEWFPQQPDAAAIQQSPKEYIPVRVHGDDAPLHQTRRVGSMYVLQWT